MPDQITLSAEARAFEADLEQWFALGVALGNQGGPEPAVTSISDKDAQARETLYDIGWLTTRRADPAQSADTFLALRRSIQHGLSDGEAGLSADSSDATSGSVEPQRSWLQKAYAVSRDKGRRIAGLPKEPEKSGSVWKLVGIAVAIAGAFVIGNAIIGVGAKKNPIRKLGTVSFASERIVNSDQVRALLSESQAVVFRSKKGTIVKIHRSDDGFTVSVKQAGRTISATYRTESVAADRFMDFVQGQQGEFYQLF